MTMVISLVVRWLGFHTSNAGGTVQPLVGGLRLHMLCGVAKIYKSSSLKTRNCNQRFSLLLNEKCPFDPI